MRLHDVAGESSVHHPHHEGAYFIVKYIRKGYSMVLPT
jgi:hypothetical protein